VSENPKKRAGEPAQGKRPGSKEEANKSLSDPDLPWIEHQSRKIKASVQLLTLIALVVTLVAAFYAINQTGDVLELQEADSKLRNRPWLIFSEQVKTKGRDSTDMRQAVRRVTLVAFNASDIPAKDITIMTDLTYGGKSVWTTSDSIAGTEATIHAFLARGMEAEVTVRIPEDMYTEAVSDASKNFVIEISAAYSGVLDSDTTAYGTSWQVVLYPSRKTYLTTRTNFE
jgi:hypothetical protein